MEQFSKKRIVFSKTKENKMSLLRLLVCILASYCLQAYAGSVDQDPIIRDLRSEFQKSHVPSSQDLRLGAKWWCQTYSTMPNNFAVTPNQVFTLQSSGNRFLSNVNNDSVYYDLEAKALTSVIAGIIPYTVVHDVIRVNSKGTLICEQSTEFFRSDDAKKYYGEPSLFYSNALAFGYSVCVPAPKVVPQKPKAKHVVPKQKSAPKPVVNDNSSNDDANTVTPPRSEPVVRPQPRAQPQYACHATGFCQRDYIEGGVFGGVTRTESFYVSGAGDSESSALSDLDSNCSGSLSMSRVYCN